jgi:hypothetical protein
MARKSDGACANPKQIRNDVDCRAARPKFDNGAWSPAKISDVTGRGLYLFVTPGESRPGNAASKLWRMGYRFHSRQKTYSIGPYGWWRRDPSRRHHNSWPDEENGFLYSVAQEMLTRGFCPDKVRPNDAAAERETSILPDTQY